MSALLQIEGLHAGYSGVPVLRGITLHLDAAEGIGLFGPNGHGKTTILRTVSGLLRPTAGTITFDGQDISRAKPSAIVAAGLVHAQQGNTLFGQMGVEETLELAAYTPRARTGWRVSMPFSPGSPSAGASKPAPFRAANGKCCRSVAPSCATPAC